MTTPAKVDMAAFEAIPAGQFAFALPGVGLKAALDTFEGRHTPRTVAAAQRIAGKARTVRLPRNLLRKLWRATGGWDHSKVSPGWGDKKKEQGKKFQFGDLTAYAVNPNGSAGFLALLVEFRGQPVAHVYTSYQGPWKDPQRAKAFWAVAQDI